VGVGVIYHNAQALGVHAIDHAWARFRGFSLTRNSAAHISHHNQPLAERQLGMLDLAVVGLDLEAHLEAECLA
jgi:hypothetical protein